MNRDVVSPKAARLGLVTVFTVESRERELAVKITYDKEADALYIHLLEGRFECRTLRLTDDIAQDFSTGERLVGIEVLGASRLFDAPDSPKRR